MQNVTRFNTTLTQELLLDHNTKWHPTVDYNHFCMAQRKFHSFQCYRHCTILLNLRLIRPTPLSEISTNNFLVVWLLFVLCALAPDWVLERRTWDGASHAGTKWRTCMKYKPTSWYAFALDFFNLSVLFLDDHYHTSAAARNKTVEF